MSENTQHVGSTTYIDGVEQGVVKEKKVKEPVKKPVKKGKK